MFLLSDASLQGIDVGSHFRADRAPISGGRIFCRLDVSGVRLKLE